MDEPNNTSPAVPEPPPPAPAPTTVTLVSNEPVKEEYPVLFIGICAVAVLVSLGFAASRFLSPTLEVVSEPAGATVFINGRLAGATPVSLSGMSSGQYAVRIEKNGFQPVARTLDLPTTGAKVFEKLAVSPAGSLRIDVKPRGAEVLLDGEMMGTTPLYIPAVPAGVHELVVRRTNFKTYSEKILVAPGDQLEYAGFALEDMILNMLKSQIDGDRQRVAHYMDLGHYLFVNDRLEEAAEAYARGLETAATQMTFDQTINQQERQLLMRLRAEDTNRLNEEIRKKSAWPGKDTKAFTEVLRKQQDNVAEGNIKEWTWVREQGENYRRDNRFDRAERLYVRHIEAAKGTPMVSQAYIELMRLRVMTRNLAALRETQQEFYKQYKTQPTLLRQAGNAIYTGATGFDGPQQMEVLAMAEHMLAKAVSEAQRNREQVELIALCKFELGNVFLLEKRPERAVPLYRESVDETGDASTKELRGLKLVEAYKAQNRYDEARQVLSGLLKSPRANIVERAQAELNAIEKSVPSPEQKK
jgi:tetratricopeptide (TPR) repeat protein